ncbi:DNA polymerase II [Candidatus Pacearchaeota archaeon CG06_land_8_20_14_3_00_35_12]|nr:MAG: DNA polymerase II [Candidatus Pacearchaeota archaeon CG06_land_8_20_14_3_00_35_12]
MKETILNFLRNGFLIKSDMLNVLNQTDDILILDLVEIIKALETKEKILSKDFLMTHFDRINISLKNLERSADNTKKIAIQNFISLLSMNNLHIKPKELEIKKELKEKESILKTASKLKTFKVVKNWNLPTKKIEVQDFVNYFRSRYNILKGFLQENTSLTNLTSINKISKLKQSVSIIGLVFDKKTTKNKNIILQVEDITGKVSVLIHKNKEEVYEKAKELVPDEIIAVTGTGNSEIIFANDFFYPDIMNSLPGKVEKEESAAFIADLHIGSLKFLEEPLLKFIKWLNCELGDEQQREMAKKVKYLFVVGDVVDGIGIYPGQEDELIIKDIREQYAKAAELLSKIRKDIIIFLCPGNHDAVRIAEPQPFLDKRFAEALQDIDNLILLSNPATVTIGNSNSCKGFSVLMYHGYSFDHYAGDIEHLRLSGAFKKPDLIVQFLLKKRHLAPMHTSTLYFPSEIDPLLLTEAPDILVSAHMHKSAISSHNKITTICCSCWQSKTAFQEKVGHEPDTCKVPIMNLKTNKINIIDFNE